MNAETSISTIVDMAEDTYGMTQLAHARALNMLADTGIDPDTARYIMKRLYDLGFTARERDPDPGAAPPGDDTAPMHPAKAARLATRQRALAEIRAATAAAKAAKDAEIAAEIEAAERAEADEKARIQRALAVQRVLAGIP